MLQLKNLKKSFRFNGLEHEILSGIDLNVRSGQILGILGESGAGKSTLLRCINLLTRPDSGHVLFDNTDLMTLSPQKLREARQQIGMIFQQFNLLSQLNVFDNVALPQRLLGLPSQQVKKKVDELLAIVGLTEKTKAFPATLSGGQKQRVAIARALASNPKLLLSDEATSALDAETTTAILKLLKQLNQEYGLTIVLVTHERSVIKSICTEVALVADGQLQAHAPVLEFYEQEYQNNEVLWQKVKYDVPTSLRSRYSANATPGASPLLLLTFFDHTAEEPVISALIKKYGVDINLLHGHIETIAEQSVGQMLLELEHVEPNSEQLRQILQDFSDQKIKTQVVGYVS